MWRAGRTPKGNQVFLYIPDSDFFEAICSSIVVQKFPSRALPLGSTFSKSGSTTHAQMITLTWSSGRPQICRRYFCCSCPWVLSCSLQLIFDTLLPDSLTGLEHLQCPFLVPQQFSYIICTSCRNQRIWKQDFLILRHDLFHNHAARAAGSFALLAEKHPSLISGDGRALLARVGKSDVQKIQTWKSAAWIITIHHRTDGSICSTLMFMHSASCF